MEVAISVCTKLIAKITHEKSCNYVYKKNQVIVKKMQVYSKGHRTIVKD